MTFHDEKNFWRNSSRRVTFELLESRDLLDGSGLLDEVHSAWSDFSISDNAHIYEIAATNLSAASLRSTLTEAMNTPGDDLIVLHTTEERHSFAITTSEEFNINVAGKGTLTIVSMGTSPLTIDARNASRLFNFQGGTCQLGGLILTGGYTNTNLEGVVSNCGLGGALANSGTLSLSRVTIENCSAGGLFDPTGTYSSSFSKGGAIYNTGTLTLIDSVLNNNTALSSGCNIIKTTAYGMGGALYNDSGTVLIRNTTFQNNIAQAELSPYQILVGENIETRYTRQEGIGGALYSSKGTISIEGGRFLQNSAWNGGACVSDKSVLTCSSRVLFEQNSAGSNGGAVLVQGQNTSNISLSFDRCEFLGNVANGSGGAIASRTALLLTNSIMSGNDAGVNGGAAYLFGSWSTGSVAFKIEFLNCTITGNRSGIVSTGSGAGIYFSGIDDSDNFAKLYVKNSIIINNIDAKPSSLSNDPNLALKDGVEEYCFGNNTLTSFTSWRFGADNPTYNPAISPFRRDYNFDTKKVGDYHLDDTIILAENNPAIDQGNNSYLDLSANPSDFSGQARINNDLVDLGAYEYQPTSFVSAFPSQLSVQQGGSFNLQCRGSDANGNQYKQYMIDFNGDNIFDITGSNLWISWKDLSDRVYDEGYFWLAVENEAGEISETRQVTVHIIEVQPSIYIETRTFLDNQILKYDLFVRYYERSAQKWIINWGDGTEITEYNCLANSLSIVHYYGPQNVEKTFPITLSLTDSNGNGGDTTYYLGSHTVTGNARSEISPMATSGNESETISFMTDEWYDAEKTEADSSSNLCWAGASANILYYTGWANEIISDTALFSFDSEDSIMDYFVEHFNNGCASIYYAVEWFLTGEWNAPSNSVWAHNLEQGGGFYSDVVPDDVRKFYNYSDSDSPETIFSETAQLLTEDYGVGLSIGVYNAEPSRTLINGHAITLWGYTCDTQYQSDDPNYYSSIIISDSDDNKYTGANAPNNLVTVNIEWNTQYHKYQLLDYKSNNRTYWLEEVVALSPKTKNRNLSINTTESSTPINVNMVSGNYKHTPFVLLDEQSFQSTKRSQIQSGIIGQYNGSTTSTLQFHDCLKRPETLKNNINETNDFWNDLDYIPLVESSTLRLSDNNEIFDTFDLDDIEDLFFL